MASFLSLNDAYIEFRTGCYSRPQAYSAKFSTLQLVATLVVGFTPLNYHK